MGWGHPLSYRWVGDPQRSKSRISKAMASNRRVSYGGINEFLLRFVFALIYVLLLGLHIEYFH